MAFLKRPQLIPEGWEEHHQPILDGSYTAIAELRGPLGDIDYDTGEREPGELIATGIPCRIQPLVSEGRGGGETANRVDTRAQQVTAPLDQVPKLTITDAGPILYVTGYKEGHAGDPHLIGQPLRVTNMRPGSLAWERVLSATQEV